MVTRLVTGCVRPRPCVPLWYVGRVFVDLMRLGLWPFLGLFCLLRGCVALEYALVSLGQHCFLRLARALCCRSRRCLASVNFSV